ncbi:MAG: antibiotic biosynthesis monooxygenase [Chloroflexi bacterium]|nr:antibiotic biosynthesis monooxygenase [Chloroflexota bacterium]
MALRLVVTFKAKTGNGEDVVKEMKPHLASVRREPGCHQYDLFQSVEDPDVSVLLERWRDQMALEAHGKGIQSWLPRLDALLVEGGRQGERYEV